jgi:hypothetical protein
MPKIDQGNWVSIQAYQPEVKGTLEFDEIYEIDTHVHHYTIPVELPLSLEIQGRVNATNTNIVDQLMKGILWFEDPDGEIVAYNESEWYHKSPGSYIGFGSGRFILDKVGTWIFYAELYAEIE